MRKAILILLASFLLQGMVVAQEVEKQQQEKSADDGWVQMFNGENLLGWHINENPDSFYVEDGSLVVHGDRGHAFYAGPTGNCDLKNFEFQAKVKTMKGANSGIYFHTKFLASGWPDKGYEAQVNNTQKDKKKTGGLYAVQDNFEPFKDDEWMDYRITVKGKHIVIMINGKKVSDYTEPDDLDRPERCLSSGTFALQAHDPGSKVYYKDLMVKALPDDKPESKEEKKK